MSTARENLNEIQLVVFQLAGKEFGTDISSILEITRLFDITPIPQAPEFILGVVNLRGQVIAVMDLAKYFGLKREAEFSHKARMVVVKLDNETLGFIVDEVVGLTKLASSEIEPTPELSHSQIRKDYICGVGRQGERLILIIDLKTVLSPQEYEALGQQLEASQGE